MFRQCGFPVMAWLLAASVAAAAPPDTTTPAAPLADSLPSGEEVARLCVAHGRYCDCPGCRAYYNACEIPCPPSIVEPGMVPDASQLPGDAEGPATESPAAEPESMSGPMPAVTASMGAIAASTSASPGMIGDFFGGGYQYMVSSPANGAAVAVAGGDRVLKFADNNCPLPQNRVFFNYHMFNNPVLDVHGDAQDVNRMTFGLEKTFWDGTASLEFRIPFEASVDSTQSVAPGSNTTGAEFGNLALALKTFLYRSDTWFVSGGLGMIFPTADDSTINNTIGDAAVTFYNQSYFLQPFIGVYARPTNRLFTQFVTQVNFDVSGSTVAVFDGSFFGDTGSDRIYEQPLLFLDYSIGYWMYQTKRHDVWITGIAPMFEIHYTTTLKPLDLPNVGNGVFEPDLRRDALNLTGGLLFSIGPKTSLRVAGVAPLRDESLMFDSEFGLQLIRRY